MFTGIANTHTKARASLSQVSTQGKDGSLTDLTKAKTCSNGIDLAVCTDKIWVFPANLMSHSLGCFRQTQFGQVTEALFTLANEWRQISNSGAQMGVANPEQMYS